MRKIFSVFVSFALIFTLLPPIGTSAQENVSFDEYGIKKGVNKENLEGLGEESRSTLSNDEWIDWPYDKLVVLNKEWSIKFSGIATADKIDAIVIEENTIPLPVNVEYTSSEIVKVKATENFRENQKYVLKIFLANGKKYKMNFTTIKENPKDKALREAEDAVSALPALMDVMEKDLGKIDEAAKKVEAAKKLGAVVTKLEATIAELREAAAPPEIKSVKVIGASTIQVTFNKAVDTSVALFESPGRTVKSMSFNAKGTIATVEFASNLVGGTTPTVTVGGISTTALSTSVTVEVERVERIEILSDKANRIGETLQVGYIVENQYGEDITKKDLAKVITPTVSDLTATKVEAIGGTAKITVPTNTVEEGKKFSLTLTHTNGKTTNKILTVSMDSAVTDIKITDLYNKTNPSKGKLTETTKLGIDGTKDEEDFYLLIDAKDGFGNDITSDAILNAENAIRIFVSDKTIVNVDSEFVDVPGKGMGLKLTGKPRAGKMTVTLTATVSGKKDQFEVIVAEDARTDVIEIVDFTKNEDGSPKAIVAKEELFIPIKASDKEGDPINGKNEKPDWEEIFTDSISGIKYTFSSNLEAKIDVEGNEIGLRIEGKDVHPGNYTLTVESSTKRKVTKTFTVEPAAIPTRWKWKSGEAIETEINLKGLTEAQRIEEPITQDVILNKDGKERVIVYDQHGREVDGKDYTLVVKTIPQTDGGIPAVSVKGTTISAVAIGTTSVTIGIKKGQEVIGEQTIEFTVEDESGYIRYEVKPIGLVYDAKAAGKELSAENAGAYNVKVDVSGVLKSGYKDKLTVGTGDGTYTISDSIYLNKAKATDGEIQLENTNFDYDGKDETKRTIAIVINQSGEVHKPDVTFSKVRPQVKAITSLEHLIRHEGSTSFGTATLVTKAKFTATDQYGKESKQLEEPYYQFVFKDGTEVETKLTLATASGAGSGQQLFTTDNHQRVTDFTANSVFNAVLWVGTLASKPVEVRTNDDYMPTVEKEAKKITVTALEGLKNGQYAQDEAQKLVDSDYIVTIKKSENAAIAPITGVVTQKATETPGNVTFTVTHKTKNLFTYEQTVNLTVPAATEVIVDGSLGTAGAEMIIGLEAGKIYFVTELITGKDSFYSVSEDGRVTKENTKVLAETASVALKAGITSISGLTNGKTYRVEEVAPTEVTVIGGLVNDLTAGDKKITGLKSGNKYVVTSGTKFYSVLENGTLSVKSSLESAQMGSEVLKPGTTIITGLENGVTYKVEVAPPVALQGVTAIPGNSKVTINFPAPVGATSVKIKQKTTDTDWRMLDSPILDKESTVAVIDSGIDNGTAYQFCVVVEGGPYAGESNPTVFVTPTNPISNLSVTNVGDQVATIIFSKPTGATSVKVEQSINSGTSWTLAKTEDLDQNSEKANITGLDNGKSYQFRVFVEGGQNAGYSNIVKNNIPKATIKTQAIAGIAKPVKGGTPTPKITETTEYTATIIWNPTTTPFGEEVYTATITILPKFAYKLEGIPENFFAVPGAKNVTNAADSGVVTAVFPTTAVPVPVED